MSTTPGGVDPDLSGLRRRLADSTGRTYWKSLEELARAPQFLEFLHREFPEQAASFDDPEGRRGFLRVMGASLALAGLTGCTRQPEEKIVPYVKPPEDVVPGRPLFFATAVSDGGYAKGVLVESHMGRPTKVEGNPDHPASLGATDVFGQASVLDLYDPDRSQTLTYLGEIRPWGSFLAAVKTALDGQRATQGAGLRILSDTVTSPTLAAQIQELLGAFPAARWHQYDPVGPDSVRAATAQATGAPSEVLYDLAKADVIVCLDADFVGFGPANLSLIRAFANRRKLGAEQSAAGMNRLYVAESSVSLTGAQADHRLPMRASEVEGVARAIAAGVGASAGGATSPSASVHGPWVAALVKDLQAHAGRSLVMAGPWQPAAVHVLAHAINQKLGNVGQTVSYAPSAEARPLDQTASLRDLAAAMDAGQVQVLVVLGGNPVYDAPADLGFARAMDKVALRIHVGVYDDETAERCHWHVPAAHSLEAWSDARAFDGSVAIVQPLIAPLYAGCKSGHEVLAAFTSKPERSGYDIVRDHWKARGVLGADEKAWQRALHDGVLAAPAFGTVAGPGPSLPAAAAPPPSSPAAMQGLEIVFRPDASVRDGRYANNGWLQELPRPLTKLTWDNAALMSPRTAESLGISIESTSLGSYTDVVELRYRGRSVKAPAWIVPGHPDGTVTVHLGYGRTRAGRVGSGVGFNAYALRTSDAPWFGGGLEVRKTGERQLLACTQDHWSMEGRNPVRAGTLEEYEKEPAYAKEMVEEPARDMSLYPAFKYGGHAWGMAIDLNSCVGCNACTIACQAENNIPVVGKEEVGRGREMHWIRVDRYYSGPVDNPDTHHQPVPCMHCENAPCEVVCPVAATTHSDEGLNDMVYNRCVGTRYCSNNCPYKVRRFNFFLYSDFDTPSLKLQKNPEVTVRSRGVMEKCTYCVQRINRARIDARNEGRPIKDGDIKTACQAACPGEAIVFGDINDPASRVAKLKAEPRNYGLLADLNTRPRTTYLSHVRNPNPEMPGGGAPEGAHD
jgi:molybdopterin-containing oxidoreductase family iron-sulfur binding subunit